MTGSAAALRPGPACGPGGPAVDWLGLAVDWVGLDHEPDELAIRDQGRRERPLPQQGQFGAGLDPGGHTREGLRMVLSREVGADGTNGSDLAFGPARPLDSRDQARSHDDLAWNDPLQLSSSVASLGKHPHADRRSRDCPAGAVRAEMRLAAALEDPDVRPAHEADERGAPDAQARWRSRACARQRRTDRIRRQQTVRPPNALLVEEVEGAGGVRMKTVESTRKPVASREGRVVLEHPKPRSRRKRSRNWRCRR